MVALSIMPVSISLSNGGLAIVDDADAANVQQYVWWRTKSGPRKTYVRGWVNGKRAYLHRFIMAFPSGIVDHINGDRMDNRRSNLRIVTNAQNIQNGRTRRTNNKTGFKGVCWDTERSKFLATITVNKQTIHIGRFNSAIEAARAYDAAARLHHGEFARLNFDCPDVSEWWP